MVLEEYDYQKHMELERRDARLGGLEEGKSIGLTEGKSLGLTEGRIAEAQRINQLILLLLSNSREGDIAKMACDKVFQEQLFLEFGL